MVDFDLNLKDFLLCVVLIEHILKFIKIFIEAFIIDIPTDVVNGVQERNQLIGTYEDQKLKILDHIESEVSEEPEE